MTWNEFKKEVDRQLKEKGISGDEVLQVVEVRFNEIQVERCGNAICDTGIMINS
jgi:isopentenyl diphosphate isomerase/L-lactate dehydrogenase-like FMN-dependent dehydrogenase